MYTLKILFISIIALALLNCSTTKTKSSGTPSGSGSSRDLALAQYKMEQGEYQDALKILTPLHNKNKSNTVISINLASVYFNLGQHQKSASILDKISHKNAATENLKGAIAIEKKNIKEAESLFKAALKFDRENKDSLYNLAYIYDIYYQQLPQALVYYKQYLSLDPNDTETADWVAQIEDTL